MSDALQYVTLHVSIMHFVCMARHIHMYITPTILNLACILPELCQVIHIATKSKETHGGGGGGWGGLGNGAGVPLPDLFIPASTSVGSRHLTTKPDLSQINVKYKCRQASSVVLLFQYGTHHFSVAITLSCVVCLPPING